MTTGQKFIMKNFNSENLYSEWQVNNVLENLGIDVRSETDSVFLAYCPFHRNTNTPSFAVNKASGLFCCYAPQCDVFGNLLKLVMQAGSMNLFQAKRFINKYEGESKPIAEQVEDLFSKKENLPGFPQEKINEMVDSFWNSPAHEYMSGRGFTDKTLAYFEIGYSSNKGLVAVPIHDWEANPVGVIGRTIVGKRFQNSKNVPTSKTLFNVHRAKKQGERVIIVESSMDAMRLHQAGFPCAVATCGGMLSANHEHLLNRYFNEVIIMTDMDIPSTSPYCKKCENTCQGHSAGRALGEKIAEKLKHKRIRWASWDYGIVYPHGAKDVGDMEENEIKQCIDNAISSAEYEMMKRDFPLLAKV